MMMRALMMAMTLAVALAACQRGPNMDVRTYQLSYIEPAAANRIIDPYVFADRGGMVSIDQESGVITVRETPEMLDRIGEVLQRYDQPEPSIRLHFRIIEANGTQGTDPALEEIEKALPKEVFRFNNYRQVAQAVVSGIEYSKFSQRVAGGGASYQISGTIGEVRAAGDSGTVQLQVGLSLPMASLFETAVNARLDQLLVLGTGQPSSDSGALILAVRAELERP